MAERDRVSMDQCGATHSLVDGDTTAPSCVQGTTLSKGADSTRLERQLSQPAEGLGKLLNRINAYRIYGLMQGSSQYGGLKYAYAANTLGCLGDRVWEDPTAVLTQMRAGLADVAAPIQNYIRGAAVKAGSTEPSLQGQMLNIFGIDVSKEIRLDTRLDTKKPTGPDCAIYESYSPIPHCNAANPGYPSYSDGFDNGTDLIGYLVLRELFQTDSQFQASLMTGLTSAQTYIANQSGGSGINYGASYLSAAIADLQAPSTVPGDLPSYLQTYLVSTLVQWGGNTDTTCRLLLSRLPAADSAATSTTQSAQ